MSDYHEEFESLWKKGVPSRSSGRKEAGYRVYIRTKKIYEDKIKELEKDIKEKIKLIKHQAVIANDLATKNKTILEAVERARDDVEIIVEDCRSEDYKWQDHIKKLSLPILIFLNEALEKVKEIK